MKEVSCRVFDPLLRDLQRKKIDPSRLLVGTSCTVETISSKRERIEWLDYVRIMANAEQVWSDEELVSLGGALLRSPALVPVALIARLLFTAADFYRWVARSKGGGNQMFPCIVPTSRDTGPGRIDIELNMETGREYSRGFFLAAKGGFIEMPRLVGQKPATVEMTLTPQGARYEITYPRGGGLIGRIWRAIGAVFRARAAAVALRDAHEELLTRYQELESAREGLGRQAHQLNTAHTIGHLVHHESDLERTIQSVASAFVDVASFSAARILVAGHEARAGEALPEPAPITYEMENGQVHLWCRADADNVERRELLQLLMPTISMAVDRAIQFRALSDYQVNLEGMVATRTTDLEATVVRMREAQEARDKIFANINHELRTPLSLVMLAVSAIERRERAHLAPKSHQELETVGAAVRRVLRMVDELLLLASGQEGKLELRFVPCDVALLLRETVMTWSTAATEHQLQLSFEGPAHCTWNLDPAALDRIITNLVSNAIKFTPQGGSIEVRLRELDDGGGARLPEKIEIEVRDSGIGLDEEFRGRMFGRFEQGRPAVHAGASGSGIGLSVVRQLVEAHQGEIAALSPRTGGTVFRVTLPPQASQRRPGETSAMVRKARLAPDDFGLARTRAAGGVAMTTTTIGPASMENRAAATVLVAEDDPDLRASIVDLLSEQYNVILAPDGITALQMARRHLPDILVTDVGMPGMDGIELTRRFRELPGNRLAPVLLLTAFGSLSDRLAGFDAGAVDYICKPFEPQELMARVRSQLALRSMALKLHQSEKLSALGVLSAGLAHEIRNPANAIVNAVAPLRECLPPELVAEGTPPGQLLDVLDRCAQQVANLSRQLLGFKRPSADLIQELTSVDGIMDHAVTVVQPAFKNVTLQKDLAAGLSVNGSGPLLAQVLANLLENGAHAAGDGGWVRIASRVEGDRLLVEISDSGPGVAPPLRERIFEPFFTTKPPGKGTGLGLTTSREIVEQHQGILKVMDSARGSLFRLELPLPSQSEPAQRATGWGRS